MAERRMFAKSIIDSDAFLDMPLSAQALYFHLSIRADDDGFINNPKKIQRMTGCSAEDLKLLIAKRFVLVFDSGVVAIRHWKIHNYIQKDRYKQTIYLEEKSTLQLDSGGAYTVRLDNGYTLDTQDSIGKDSIGKDSAGKDSIGKDSTGKDSAGKDSIGKDSAGQHSQGKTDLSCGKDISVDSFSEQTKHRYGEHKNVLLTDDEMQKLKARFGLSCKEKIDTLSNGIALKGYRYKSHYLALLSWFKEEAPTGEDCIISSMLTVPQFEAPAQPKDKKKA